MLQELEQELSDSGINVTAISIEGSAVEELLEEIERLGIDLVIMGSHAPGFLDLLFGARLKA